LASPVPVARRLTGAWPLAISGESVLWGPSIRQPNNTYWQAEPGVPITVPVARPRLPSLDEIAGYIARIDETRWYSNGGPLCGEFEARLAERSGKDAHVVTVSNATVGLMLALQAVGAAPGTLCMVPAWTFVATAHAACMAGLVPWIVDVDLESWALDADAVRDTLRRAPGKVSAIIVVAPFGQPLDPAPWARLREETGVAVVIDAAAAFDTARASSVPTVVSLHATKALGVGEGGYVVCTDPEPIGRIRQSANFGFGESREAMVPGANGKLSEYAAAVGLAALDAWSSSRDAWVRVAMAYRKALDGANGVSLQPGFGPEWISSTVMASFSATSAETVAAGLSRTGVGTRRWWGGGLHRHRAFAAYPHLETPNTDGLVEAAIGLPCWMDLPDSAIEGICSEVRRLCA
jgi:dTDP-4-amino-4,6-dideoxygalactose transaminase